MSDGFFHFKSQQFSAFHFQLQHLSHFFFSGEFFGTIFRLSISAHLLFGSVFPRICFAAIISKGRGKEPAQYESSASKLPTNHFREQSLSNAFLRVALASSRVIPSSATARSCSPISASSLSSVSSSMSIDPSIQ
jgi:hypothetical protein